MARITRINGQAQPYAYRAMINQFGSSAPEATIIENTLGFTPVWSYVAAAQYLLTGNFPYGRTFFSVTPSGIDTYITWQVQGESIFYQTVFDDSTYDVMIEVLVYPE